MIRFLATGAVLAGVPGTMAAGTADSEADVPRWSVHEIALEAEREYDNPYLEADVTATFTSPEGEEVTALGFWDGDDVFKIRFTPIVEGRWEYVTRSEDPGLDGRRGVIRCGPPAPGARGFVRRDPEHPRHFVRDDGGRFFMLGTTYYELISAVRAGEDWRTSIDRCLELGITKVRFRLYVKNCGDRVNPAPCSRPWLDGDPDALDLDHWRAADEAIAHMDRVGMVADFMPFNSTERAYGTPEQDERLLRYVIARYAAYPNLIWCLTNEFQRAGRPLDYLNALGRRLRDEDPWIARGEALRPLSIHPLGGKGEGDSWKLGDESWPVHVILQYGRLTPGDQIHEQQVEARRHGLPVVNDEWGYLGDSLWRDARGNRSESSNHYTREAHRRTMWAIYIAGSYGSTGDKYQYDDGRPYQSGTWHERPEYDDVSALAELFTNKGLEYWTMAPDPEAVASGDRVYVLSDPGRQYVAYAAAGGTVALELPEGRYTARRFDPRNGRESDLGPVRGGEARFELPDEDDWVIYLIRDDRRPE